MKLSTFESGRSMVEILGVLAIIGLLSYGGIYGYQVSMDKREANEISQAARLRANEVSHQMQKGSKPTLDDFEDQVGDVEIYVTSTDNKDQLPLAEDSQFAIHLNKVPKRVAKQLVNSGAVGVSSGVVGIVDADLSPFEDIEDLSPSEDGSYHMALIYDSKIESNCPAGSYIKDNKCTKCPDGSVCFGGTESFTSCPAASIPNADKTDCVPCAAGEVCGCPRMSDGKGNCVECLNSGDCSNTTFCYNNTCRRCPDGADCSDKTVGDFKCIQEGYTKGNALCCPPNAQCDLTAEGSVSVSCNENYYQTNKECKTCPPGASCLGGANDYTCASGHKENGICCPDGAICDVTDKDENNDGVPDYTITCQSNRHLNANNECIECPEAYVWDEKSQSCESILVRLRASLPQSSTNIQLTEILSEANASCKGSNKYMTYSPANNILGGSMTLSCQTMPNPITRLMKPSDADLVADYQALYFGTVPSWQGEGKESYGKIAGDNPTAQEIRATLDEILKDYWIIPCNNWLNAKSWCNARGGTLASYDELRANSRRLLAAMYFYREWNIGRIWASAGTKGSSTYCSGGNVFTARSTRWQCAGADALDNSLQSLCHKP